MGRGGSTENSRNSAAHIRELEGKASNCCAAGETLAGVELDGLSDRGTPAIVQEEGKGQPPQGRGPHLRAWAAGTVPSPRGPML